MSIFTLVMSSSGNNEAYSTLLLAGFLAMLTTACTTFEDRRLVIDLRMLAITAEPPEVVFDVDLEAETPEEAIDQNDLVDVEYCGLIADPVEGRRLSYVYSICRFNRARRCDQPNDPGDTVIQFGNGTIDDPEDGPTEATVCATLQPTIQVQQLLIEEFESNPASIITGVELMVELRIDSLGPTEERIYGNRTARYSGRFPIDRVANNNPEILGLDVIRDDGSETELPLGRCADIEPLVLGPGEKVEVTPREPEGLREDYVLVDLEQNRVPITENITYNWLTTDGDWRSASTGGPDDGAGNTPLIRNFWTAPDEVGNDIDLWITQRDERLGGSWFQSCVRVGI